jgi:hypothetical protein
VAIGAYYNDGNVAYAGHVRIYQLDGTAWTQLGGDIDGEAYYDYSGQSVSLSSDGLTVAIGAAKNDGTNSVNDNRGHVRIYGLGQAKPIVVEGLFSTVPPGCSLSSSHLRLNSISPSNIACSELGKCLCKSRAPWRGSSEVCRKKQFYKSANYYRSEHICDSALNASECEAAAAELGLQFSQTGQTENTPVTSGCIMHDNGHVTYKNGIHKDYCAYNTGKECICKSDGLDRSNCNLATGLKLADLTQKEDYGPYYRSGEICSPSDSFDNDQECKVAAEWLKSNRIRYQGLTDIDPQLLITDTIVFSPLENTNTCFLDGNNFYWKNNHLNCGDGGGCVCKRNELPKGCSTYNSKAYWSDNSNENPNEKYHKVDIIPNTNFIIDSGSTQKTCVEKNKEFKFGFVVNGFTKQCLDK